MDFKNIHLHEDGHQDPSTGQNLYGIQYKMEEFKLYTNGAAKSNQLIIRRYKNS